MSGFHTADDVKAVEQVIGAFMSLYPAAEWGPAHIALSDDNLRDSDLEFCLGQPKRKDSEWAESTDGEHAAVQAFLRFLLTVPEEIRTQAWERRTQTAAE